MGFKIGDVEDENEERVMGFGDGYIQKLVKKDADLANLWGNVSELFEERTQKEKKKSNTEENDVEKLLDK